MGNTADEQEQKVIVQYSDFPEGQRLTYTKAHETEFRVTMHYLHKFLTPGQKLRMWVPAAEPIPRRWQKKVILWMRWNLRRTMLRK